MTEVSPSKEELYRLAVTNTRKVFEPVLAAHHHHGWGGSASRWSIACLHVGAEMWEVRGLCTYGGITKRLRPGYNTLTRHDYTSSRTTTTSFGKAGMVGHRQMRDLRLRLRLRWLTEVGVEGGLGLRCGDVSDGC